jgi:hypothetical protein
LKNGKLEAITEYAKIRFPNRKKNVILHTYKGSDVRVYSKSDQIHLLYPEDVTEIQMESVADAIAKGTIFDDADEVDRHAQYVTLTNTPTKAMMQHGCDEPKCLKIVLSGIIGRMTDDGTIEICASDMMNGKNFIDQLKDSDKSKEQVNDLVDHYLGTKDHQSLPDDLKIDTAKIPEEIESITSLDDDDVISDEDFEFLDMGDGNTRDEVFDHSKAEGEEEPFEEGFFSKKPKKLKPIPRDVVAYITVEMNAIQDSNDQAMLAGYTCAKLDLVDFYLNCIDTQDERYIVPHNRAYLVNMQNELNRLLAQILKIRPANQSNALWRANVTLPEGYRR